MSEETWRPVEGFEDLYEVSDRGNVRGVDRVIRPSRYGKPYERVHHGGILKQHKTSRGYLQVGLTDKNGNYKYCLVHRLVATAFIPHDNDNLEVNHKDENKTNNCVENLEWCTHLYNVRYGTAIERKKRTLKQLNESGMMLIHHRDGFEPQLKSGIFNEKRGEIMASLKDMEIVSKVLGVNPQTVRYGLEQGVFPFGCAVKCKKRSSYIFFPEMVKKYLGVNLDEERN